MKVLVLGSTGMLGSAFLKTYSNNSKLDYYFSVRTHKQLNLLINKFKINKKKIIYLNVIEKETEFKLKLLRKRKFDFIINCIGVIKPHIDESKSDSILNALKINSLFPNILSTIFQKDTKILQIATDCVYSGKSSFYSEDDKHDPEDVYGKSKSLGEVNSSNFYNIRCSIIGEELNNGFSLVEWFKSQKLNTTINGFANHQWNGLTTNTFVKLIESIIINKINIPNNIHIIPKNHLSKYKLLSCLKKKYNRTDLKLNKDNHQIRVDRTIDTKFKKINDQIWNKSFLKRNY